MLARVRRTITERGLLERGHHVLVACSGGPDSVALTHVLARLCRQLGITAVVASVDHGLRPEAPREVELARSLAGELALPFFALEVQLPSGTGSLQAAARRGRYEALRELAAQQGADRIAVGHTRHDQAETVLGRMLRGAGVRGLSGIAPRRRDGVVRPLIDCRREWVRAHLDRHGLAFAEDPSNRDRRFQRVRLRGDLLPALEAEDARLVDHLADLADDARATTRSLTRQGAPLTAEARARPRLPLDVLTGRPRALRRVALRAYVEARTGHRPGRAHLDTLDRMLQGRGEAWLPGGWRVRIERGCLVTERLSGQAGTPRDC